MGAPISFEYRRKELSIVLNKAEVSDEEVVQSCLDMIGPEGDLLFYLKHCKVGLILNDVLIVHGAINNLNYGYAEAEEGGVFSIANRNYSDIVSTDTFV